MKMKTILSLLVLTLFGIATGCTNITKKNVNTLTNPAIIGSLLGTNSNYTHILNNVTTAAIANGGGTSDTQLTLAADTSQANYQSLMGFCGGANNPCDCELDWTEVSTSGTYSSSYTRTKKIPILSSDVQSAVWTTIPTGTTVTMNIVPVAPTNVSGLNCKAIGFKVGTSIGASGDFLDSTLTPFRNIHRYACFTKNQSPFQILNKYYQAQPSSTPQSGTAQTINLFFASQFCASDANNSGGTNANTGGTGGGQCATPRNGGSAQNYYRNFYIRSDLRGQINSTNPEFDCPLVQASVLESAQGTNVPAADAQKFWPLDTTFALATTYSADWSVGVRAASILYKSTDPNSTQDACTNEDITKRMTEAGTVTKCLGYGKKPNVDGTCTAITDSNGHIRPLTRLRRYRVIYPPVFQPNGDTTATNPNGDEVYVADRLVMDANGVPTGNMIYGPKPCNYSWFDHEGVTTRDGSVDFRSDLAGDGSSLYATPGYVATSQYYYIQNRNQTTPGPKYYPVNPDGLVFPNKDVGNTDPTIAPSCSSVIPVVTYQSGSPNAMHLLTINQGRGGDYITLGQRTIYLNEVHVQPIDPWIPNYVEDLSFQACVPLSDPYLEPPLHFTKSTTSMDWCAEVYPTQNPYWADLNAFRKPKAGNLITDTVANYPTGAIVPIYTSHLSTPSSTSSIGVDASSTNYFHHYLDGLNASCLGDSPTFICNMSGGDSNCPAFLARGTGMSTTCDRTVIFDSNQQYRGFPLLAADKDIEAMLANDLSSTSPNFSCMYSVNSDATKVNKSMPSSACCGVLNSVPLLNPLITATPNPPFVQSGHLEPYKNPSTPTIRFCGSPVQ